jgi:hypothetical protein
MSGNIPDQARWPGELPFKPARTEMSTVKEDVEVNAFMAAPDRLKPAEIPVPGEMCVQAIERRFLVRAGDAPPDLLIQELGIRNIPFECQDELARVRDPRLGRRSTITSIIQFAECERIREKRKSALELFPAVYQRIFDRTLVL